MSRADARRSRRAAAAHLTRTAVKCGASAPGNAAEVYMRPALRSLLIAVVTGLPAADSTMLAKLANPAGFRGLPILADFRDGSANTSATCDACAMAPLVACARANLSLSCLRIALPGAQPCCTFARYGAARGKSCHDALRAFRATSVASITCLLACDREVVQIVLCQACSDPAGALPPGAQRISHRITQHSAATFRSGLGEYAVACTLARPEARGPNKHRNAQGTKR